MSRLDYITIAIVIACIVAIIFLVYKMTDLFNDKPAINPIEVENGKVEQEDTSTYDYNLEDSLSTAGGASTDSGTSPAAGQATTTTAASSSTSTEKDEDDERTPTSRPATTSTTTSKTSSNGKFMVIAGTFSQSVHAKTQLQQLKKLGYTNATIENFDRGKYDVILVDRFDNMAAAERLVKDLKAEGVSSYVKAKERQ